MTEHPTHEGGIDERLALNRDFRDGYQAGIEATQAERDALREIAEAARELVAFFGDGYGQTLTLGNPVSQKLRSALKRPE